MLFAEEELSPAPGDMFRQDSGDAFRLIITALELAGRVQWNWHQYRPGQVTPEDVVRKGGVREVVGQERATFVFDTMDDPTGWPAGPEGADRPGEGRLKIEAMGAGTVTFEDTFERVAARQAPWVVDTGELVGPGGREVQPICNVHRFLRHRAVPGEDEVEEAAIEVSQPAHRVRPSASGLFGRAPRRSRQLRWRWSPGGRG